MARRHERQSGSSVVVGLPYGSSGCAAARARTGSVAAGVGRLEFAVPHSQTEMTAGAQQWLAADAAIASFLMVFPAT